MKDNVIEIAICKKLQMSTDVHIVDFSDHIHYNLYILQTHSH